MQNRIQNIEGLDGFPKLRNLELAANRIRVCKFSQSGRKTLMPSQEIENLDSLKGLEELWLGKNKITEIKVETALML